MDEESRRFASLLQRLSRDNSLIYRALLLTKVHLKRIWVAAETVVTYFNGEPLEEIRYDQTDLDALDDWNSRKHSSDDDE